MHAIEFTTRLVRAGAQGSVGSIVDSCDDALAENLWVPVRTECVRGRVFVTGAGARAEADPALFAYTGGFHNPRGIRKRPGSLSPIGFEQKQYANQAATE
ncbi:hypothetical protein ACFV2Q_02510 [Streptomyces sp. NPDC059650]|uniref:hypothetical protein n=1 Tax=Streptomyces sp. NPDC059650 TaxID=3346896 RepID=UPI0036AE10FE